MLRTTPEDEHVTRHTGLSAMMRLLDTWETAPALLSDISSDLTWNSHKDSQCQFADTGQTLIFFDWDDTLFPTSFGERIMNTRYTDQLKRVDPESKKAYHSHCKRLVKEILDSVNEVLSLAKKLGKVFVVTNATRPWVDRSAESLYEGLPEAMKESVELVYAREELSELTKEQQSHCDRPARVLAKTRAMQRAAAAFYGRYQGQSWKNVVSIGDSTCEHDAIRKVIDTRPSGGKRCRTKIVKFVHAPTLGELANEIRVLANWLPAITREDDDVRIDFSDSEEALAEAFTAFSYLATAPVTASGSLVLDIDRYRNRSQDTDHADVLDLTGLALGSQEDSEGPVKPTKPAGLLVPTAPWQHEELDVHPGKPPGLAKACESWDADELEEQPDKLAELPELCKRIENDALHKHPDKPVDLLEQCSTVDTDGQEEPAETPPAPLSEHCNTSDDTCELEEHPVKPDMTEPSASWCTPAHPHFFCVPCNSTSAEEIDVGLIPS